MIVMNCGFLIGSDPLASWKDAIDRKMRRMSFTHADGDQAFESFRCGLSTACSFDRKKSTSVHFELHFLSLLIFYQSNPTHTVFPVTIKDQSYFSYPCATLIANLHLFTPIG